MLKQRKNYTAREEVFILKRLLVDHVAATFTTANGASKKRLQVAP